VYDHTEFTTSPGYANIASNVGDYGVKGFQLFYKGHTTGQSDELVIPFVVPASRINITQVNPVPNVNGLTYNVYFDAGWSGLNGNATGLQANGLRTERQKFSQPVTPVYPKIDYTYATRDRQLIAIIGKPISERPTAKPAENGWAPDNGEDNFATTKFTIDNYYGVAEVKFAGFTNPQDYTHDNLDVFFTGNSIDRRKTFNEMVKSGVKFTISYFNPWESDKKIVKEREIGIEEFYANAQWYNGLIGNNTTDAYMLQNIIMGNQYPLGEDKMRASYDSMGKIFNVDTEDGATWPVWLDYVPWTWNNSVAFSQVAVPFEMYTFGRDLRRVRDVPGPVTIWGSYNAREMTIDDLEGIKAKWHLEGSYTNEKTNTTKWFPIGLTSDMFYKGWYGAWSQQENYRATGWTSLNNSVTQLGTFNVFHPNASYGNGGLNSITATNTPGGAFPGLNSGTSEQRRDFPLPVYYRGGYLADEDETFLVNVLAPKAD